MGFVQVENVTDTVSHDFPVQFGINEPYKLIFRLPTPLALQARKLYVSLRCRLSFA